MALLIHYLVDRHEIRVGDVTFTGDVALDGRVTIDGHVVRPLTLAEREHVLARTSGPDRVDQIVRLVGDTAAPSEADPGSDVRAAMDAVALDLAGASVGGPLARTLLLVARAMGGPSTAVMAMSARDADDLASTLGATWANPGPTAATVTEDGWTTITYPAVPHADIDTPAVTSNPASVRQRLAARLIARAEQPLDPDEASALLGADVRRPTGRFADERGAPWPESGPTPAGHNDDRWRRTDSPPNETTSEKVVGADRWRDTTAGPYSTVSTARHRSPGANAEPGTTTARSTETGLGHFSAAGRAAADGAMVDPTAAAVAAPGPDLFPRSPVPGVEERTAGSAPVSKVGPAARVEAGQPSGAHIGSTRHPRPRALRSPRAAPASALRTHAEQCGDTTTAAPAATTATRISDVGTAAGADLAAVAHALHQAADRRGLPR